MEAGTLAKMTEEEGIRPLEFRLVIITETRVVPRLLDGSPDEDPGSEPVVVEGKAGQTVAWLEDEGKHIVETFDGLRVKIAEELLAELDPAPVDMGPGGFDLAFPMSGWRMEKFPFDVAATLLDKQYCLVQMSSPPKHLASSVDEALELTNSGVWTRPVPEFLHDYLGREPHERKVMWCDEALLNPRADALPGLGATTKALRDVGGVVAPVCHTLGFDGADQTCGMVQMLCQGQENDYLNHIFEHDLKITDSKQIQDYLGFASRSKICMMFFVSGSKFSLTLHHRDGQTGDIKLECQENQLLVFRHDLLDYTYVPADPRHLVLQAWVLRKPRPGEHQLEAKQSDKFWEDYEHMPKGHDYRSSDETTDVVSLTPRSPGYIWEPEGYWGLLSSGCDGCISVPLTRWDHDIYWDATMSTPGRGYMRHFGMMDHEQLASFDHEFMGMTEEEAGVSDPCQRMALEVGYECLYRGGFTRATLKGAEFIVGYGYGGSEFGALVMRTLIRPITSANNSCAMCAHRLSYIFGITGAAFTCETACSSSLSATAMMHTNMRPQLPDTNGQVAKQYLNGLACGCQGHFDPFYTIALCGAGMLTHGGRCFTFDQSADGFGRGEGCTMMYYRVNACENIAKLAVLCASAMNQDGRSATLTAPHGPSQQECIRNSLREAGIPPLDIQIQELHGTGTALGDPIEVGALRATMMSYQGQVREHPLVKTSAKSNFAHTEMVAGIHGIMKCVLMGLYSASAPNIHLRLLNPHIDSNAYPVYFSNEFVDQGSEVGYSGVSSFGFGGSNARGDVWVRAQAGPRNTTPEKATLDLKVTRIENYAKTFGPSYCPQLQAGSGPPVPIAVENLEDYKGDYLTGSPLDPSKTFYVKGSFNGWSQMEKMHWLPDKDAQCFAFALGEARIEQFQVVCNGYEDAVVFPHGKMADMEARVVGPGIAPDGNTWAIDGRAEKIPQGTVYMIYLRWDEAKLQKRVVWEECQDDRGFGLAASHNFTHGYSVVGSWSNFTPQDMQRNPAELGLFEVSIHIGNTGHEEFHFRRDGDPRQRIYPALHMPADARVPVRGPDLHGERKHWSVQGDTGHKVTLQLRVWDGDVTVSIRAPHGTKTFRNAPTRNRNTARYFVHGEWSDWKFLEMIPDSATPSRCKRQLKMPASGTGTFQVVVDEDPDQALYPELEMSDKLASSVCGPDSKGEHNHWAASATPGAIVEIILDLSAEDRKSWLTWEIV